MTPIECSGIFLESGYIEIPEEIKIKIKEEKYSKILVTLRKEKQKDIYINAVKSLNGLLSDLSAAEKDLFDSALKDRMNFNRQITEI